MSMQSNPEPRQNSDGSEEMEKDTILSEREFRDQIHALTLLYTTLGRRIKQIRQQHIETNNLNILREENKILKRTLKWLEEKLALRSYANGQGE